MDKHIVAETLLRNHVQAQAELRAKLVEYLSQNYECVPRGKSITFSEPYADGYWTVSLRHDGLMLQGYAYENLGYELNKHGIPCVREPEPGWSALYTQKEAFDMIELSVLMSLSQELINTQKKK